MKKPTFTIIVISICLLTFCSCGKEEVPSNDSGDMTRYSANVMAYEDTSSMPEFDNTAGDNVEVDDNAKIYYANVSPIFRNCHLPLTIGEYEEIASILNQSAWIKREEAAAYDVNDRGVIYLAGQTLDIIYIFPHDSGAEGSSSNAYQIPTGTYNALLVYLEGLFNERRSEVLDAANFFQNLLAEDFRLEWQMLYDPPHPQGDGEYIYRDYFTCYSSEELVRGLNAAFGDVSLWQPLAIEDSANLFGANDAGENLDIYIYGKDWLCSIFPSKNQEGTYILVNNYAAFYAPNGEEPNSNLYKNVMAVIKEQKDRWQVIYQVE
ncbi:MAG: hypothetical protein Q4C00_07220 [Bacillota bacterium]|nr:hypothetical protein [Bacillota bacterium]